MSKWMEAVAQTEGGFDTAALKLPLGPGAGKSAMIDIVAGRKGLRLLGDLPTVHDGMVHDSIVYDSPPCESFSRPDRWKNVVFTSGFDIWGNSPTPMRTYDVPPAVERGFAAYLGSQPKRAGRAPEAFHLDVSRHSSRSGRAIDMMGMTRSVDTAQREGRPIVLKVEIPPR